MSTGPGRPVVLITGASGVLGRATAPAFASGGARLGLAGRDADALTRVARDCGLSDDGWVAAVGDLRTAEGAAQTVAAVTERFGPIDIALHLVGGWTTGTAVVDLDPADLAWMLDQHVWSTFHLARAVVPSMVERGWGRFVAISSAYTTNPAPRSAAYIAGKSAEEAILRVLARELAATGVTVNMVAVRTIDGEHQRETDPAARNAAWTTPEEIVATLHFLCSDDAAALNGTRIALDGRG